MPVGDPPAPSGGDNAVRKDLSSWWKNFKKGGPKKDEEKDNLPEQQGIFGVPLSTSVRYANVAISLSDANGQSYIYGYVPIVVAKCGVFLKEKATDVEGIFRLSGSEKRIKELRNAFNSPDRYGKGLDWTGYTVHDAANILRRYFNQLPEPIIPLEFYDKFREPIRNHQSQAVGPMEGQSPSQGDFEVATAIKTFQRLITELPPLNRQLLLYILDLLAVFASKSDLNKMTTPNLAAIFQPGILSHPAHDMAPPEYRLSQDVLIFLIENQDHFLIGMQGTAADEKTVQEVESGPPTPQNRSSTPRNNKTLARSGSNSSRYSGVRRSVSASSRRSRNSDRAVPSPSGSEYQTPLASPLAQTGSGGVHRSNTLPPTRSPNLAHGRFNPNDSDAPAGPVIIEHAAEGETTPKPKGPIIGEKKLHSQPIMHEVMSPTSDEMMSFSRTRPLPEGLGDDVKTPTAATYNGTNNPPTNISATGPPSEPVTPQPAGTPRTFTQIFSKPGPGDDGRKPNKLQKKRSPLPSAHSSTHSLNDPYPPESMQSINSLTSTPLMSPQKENRPLPLDDMPLRSPPPIGENYKPKMSPTTSYMSQSDAEQTHPNQSVSTLDQDPEGKRRHWFRKTDQSGQSSLGGNSQAARSRSSVLSGGESRRSVDNRRSVNMDRGQMNEYGEPVTSDSERDSKKNFNPISWAKGKIQTHQEKKDEQKRMKSPTRSPAITASQQPGVSMNSVVSTPPIFAPGAGSQPTVNYQPPTSIGFANTAAQPMVGAVEAPTLSTPYSHSPVDDKPGPGKEEAAPKLEAVKEQPSQEEVKKEPTDVPATSEGTNAPPTTSQSTTQVPPIVQPVIPERVTSTNATTAPTESSPAAQRVSSMLNV
ncbi:RhoGAP-domain-containing protein [Microthyrium microscopicum]|uniref:RhoGAP-domain-containing protein n=1 Tax=Microthyrium microscopicum TaxID=703497 RepID=A0A6A6U600_9PEZI|nr:RhoGAP-domain-containing protein [Microthyrium microscopicum]